MAPPRPLAEKRLGPLRSVLRPAPMPIGDPSRIEGTAHDVVADTGQVLDPPTAHQHHRVLLKIVAHAGDIGVDLATIREANTSDLAKRRVRLLRRLGIHAQTHTPALGRGFEVGGLGALDTGLASVADQLLDGRHAPPVGSKW